MIFCIAYYFFDGRGNVFPKCICYIGKSSLCIIHLSNFNAKFYLTEFDTISVTISGGTFVIGSTSVLLSVWFGLGLLWATVWFCFRRFIGLVQLLGLLWVTYSVQFVLAIGFGWSLLVY